LGLVYAESIIFGFGLVSTILLMPLFIKIMKKSGIVGVDVHKREHPTVPEMGGIAIIIGLMISIVTAFFIIPEKAALLISFLATALITGIIVVVDDLKTLSAKMKPFLLLFAGLPILIMRTYDPFPVLPLVGPTRLTIVYLSSYP